MRMLKIARGILPTDFVSKTLSAEEWQNSLARAFLVRYGQREDVRRNLRANYSTESWTGERSLHLESKKDKLLRIKEGRG